MILDADMTLQALLVGQVLGQAKVLLSFDSPTKPWAAALTTPALSVWLYDVRENLERREVMFEPARDETGRIVGRRPPYARMDLAYLVSAWSKQVTIEHKLLQATLDCFLKNETVPEEYVKGVLAGMPYPVRIAAVMGVKRGMLLNLAGEQKAALELVVTIPWATGPTEPAAPSVQETPRIVAQAPGVAPELRTSVAGAGAPAAVPKAAERLPSVEERVTGGDADQPGRTAVLKKLEAP